MVNSWNKFSLLVWKNFTLQKRHKIQTLVEIVIPVLFSALLVLVRSLVEPTQERAIHYSEFSAFNTSINISQFLPSGLNRNDPSPEFEIPYSPNSSLATSTILNAMVDIIRENLHFNGLPTIPDILISAYVRNYMKPFANSSALLAHVSSPLYASNLSICGIALDDSLANVTAPSGLPNDIDITLYFPAELRRVTTRSRYLNWFTDFSFTVFQVPGPRSPRAWRGGVPSYADEGFTVVAHGLLRQLTMMKSGLNENEEIVLQRFPHPAYLSDPLITVLKAFLPLVMMLSFVYTCINTVRVIATEKELQLKEVMKVMGLDNWLHWLAWFVKAYSYILIAVILIVVLLKVEWYQTQDGMSGYSVITYTPWHFILFFLMIFTITTTCFCFMISVFFSKANTAATVAGLLWFLSFAPYTFLSNGRTLAPFTSRLLACFASNTAMSFGFEIIMNHETSSEGLQWSNLWTVITEDDPLVMGHVIVLLVVDAVIYLLIALYVEQVMPGSYGVPQPWYFLFTKTFWGSSHTATVSAQEDERENGDTASSTIEPDPTNATVGVNITNLTKLYSGNAAVNNLNLRIFEDQITVILGHNGAGKTTTMSMLTGLITPSAGTAVVAGHDIRSDMKGVRASLGLCPQHNVLFTDLTVKEHIYFFARLKGIQGEELKQQVNKYIRLLGLEEKRDVLSKTLSGGMKRRLSVAVALCGGSKVVLLDEPSSGIDPASRRELWDLLQADKKGRTIILSTHFMDEAEVLGERVAVMASGTLRAVGSPFFLKRMFSVGYTLTASTATSASVVAGPVTDFIRSHIPEATLHSNIGLELSYHLPSEFSNKFEPLLKELESKQTEYSLNSFGISAGSLEDVFMRVGADAVETLDENDELVFKEVGLNGFTGEDSNQKHIPNGDNLLEGDHKDDISKYRFNGPRLWVDQWYAMFYKHMVCTYRSWILTLLRLVIPVLFLIIAILVDRIYGLADILPSRNLALSNGYEDSETIVSCQGPLDDTKRSRMEMYEKYFEGHPTMKVVNIGCQDMEEYYLNKSTTTPMADMRKRNLVGATFSNDNKIIVWFSNFAFHDLPASLMLVYNAVVKVMSTNSTFSLTNHPLPYTLDTRIGMLQTGDSQGFQLAFNIGFSLAFVSGFYVLFYIKENATRSKLLQLASGASPFIMWMSALIWDVLCFTIISIALVITLVAFQQETFTTAVQVFRLLLLLVVFGFAMLPFHYLTSVLFQTPSTGFSRMVFFNIFTGVATFLIVEVLAFPGLDLEHVSDILHWIFLVFPHYAISQAIKNHHDGYIRLQYCYMVCDANIPGIDINGTCNMQTVCDLADLMPDFSFLKVCCIPEDPYFVWQSPGVLPSIVYMLLFGFFLFILLVVKEYRFMHIVIQKVLQNRKFAASLPTEEDSDVVAERAKVAAMDEREIASHILVCKDMSKRYKKFQAVKALSFCVEEKECFGLLGVNGAGKTTTFKMLTGDLFMSSGGAWVIGNSISTNMKAVYNHIGYCPQFDALLDEMTGGETLEMFARLKGIPPAAKSKYITSLTRKLGFLKHINKEVRAYSGGTKRKLSTAVAMLGDPEVVYLDEPTTGMDPMAKRQVWRAVANRTGGCVVLTSHSMEECEALCTRLAIMVNGSFQCLGSTQHLKNKFSQGYTLIVKLRRQESGVDVQPLQQFLHTHFPGAVLKEMYQNLVTYYLPLSHIPWSRIFGLMEEAKTALDLEDYSVGQTSLEQIFLQFTKDQVSTSL